MCQGQPQIPQSVLPQHPRTNCLIKNLPIENIVASKKMLLYSGYWYSLEGAFDESTKQTRITASNSTAVLEVQ